MSQSGDLMTSPSYSAGSLVSTRGNSFDYNDYMLNEDVNKKDCCQGSNLRREYYNYGPIDQCLEYRPPR
jgi:hypothetical protein